MSLHGFLKSSDAKGKRDMKTLYISDLDGTLLSSDASLSEKSREALRLFSSRGILVSAATARTAATVSHILADTGLTVPVILMNGVCTFDLSEKRYVEINAMSESAKKKLFDAVSGTSGFLYTIDGGRLSTFYERTDTPHSRQFRAEREEKYGKVFTRTDSFCDCLGWCAVYFSLAGYYDELSSVYDELSRESELHIEFYRDIYNTDFWYLEACAAGVSKYAAASSLKKRIGADRMIGFGDNLNDISLFEACDECYAVSNAKDEVIRRADGVIGANTADSVVRFIAERENITL